MPTIWKTAIIKPIPKSAMVDPRLPLQYRGISLLSTVYKLFSSLLNIRIIKCAEVNYLFAEEQNGFRSKRSCEDHVHVLSSIIRQRKARRLSIYVAFIDMEKAFDCIDRNLLLYKIQKYKILGVGGKIYNCIKSMYSGCKAGVNVNGYVTDLFSSEHGVRQGDALSPTLFGLYINDLVSDLKRGSEGIQTEFFNIHCLLYVDDIALIGNSEEYLQNMLNILYNWCMKWRMKLNVSKSKIVHFRNVNEEKSHYSFTYGDSELDMVDTNI